LEESDQHRAFGKKIELCLAAIFLAGGSLHFENHPRRGIDLGGEIRQLAACRAIRLVGEAGFQPSLSLDDDAVAGARKLRHDLGDERHAPLSTRDFAWNSYEHLVGYRGVINAPLR
jgi:hypothetical protein